MAKPERRMKVNELREQAIEAMKQTPYTELETDSGEVFRVWHPLLTDDQAQIRIDRVQVGEDLDKDENGKPKVPARVNGELAEPFNIRFARAILGEEEHKRFVADGGRSNDVQLAWSRLTDEYEEHLVEIDPKSDTPSD